jgi:integrase
VAVPKPATGTIEYHEWKDGRTVSWWLRVRAYGQRYRIDVGTNHEGWSEERARVELDQVNEQIERGTWKPPEPVLEPRESETLHVTASRLYQRKKAEGLEPKTDKDLKWRSQWLLRYRPHESVEIIDVEWVEDFKTWLLSQVSEKTGKPLSTRSVNMVIDFLAMVLDVAVDSKKLPANPARGPRRRLRESDKRRHVLDPDMVIDMLDAAGDWEEELRDKGQPHQCYGRRALVATLILAGPRISEAMGALRADLDVHSEVLRISKSKTAAGERDIDLTAYLLDELRPHLAASPSRLGRAPKPKTPVFHSRTGRALDPDNIRSRLLPGVIKGANKKREKAGKLLIPTDLTPHAFRRTFARLCFMADRQLDYVMGQIGHKDARMVLEIYAQMRKRRTRKAEKALVWKLMHFTDEADERPANASRKHQHAA